MNNISMMKYQVHNLQITPFPLDSHIIHLERCVKLNEKFLKINTLLSDAGIILKMCFSI